MYAALVSDFIERDVVFPLTKNSDEFMSCYGEP
jgi:hypothetical protein